MKLVKQAFAPAIITGCVLLLMHSDLVAQGIEPPNQVVEMLKSQLSSMEQHVEDLKATRDSLSLQVQQFDDERQLKLDKQDETGISEESFPEILKILQSQRVQLIIDLSGLEARRVAIESIQEDLNSGSDKEQLQIIELRTKLVEEIRIRIAELKASDEKAALRTAEKSLMEAEIRLAEAQNALGAAQSRFSDELLQAALDEAEKKARLVKVESLLANLVSARSSIDELADLDQLRDGLRDKIADVEADLTATAQKIKLIRSHIADQEDH